MRNTNTTTSAVWGAPAGTVVRISRGVYSHVGMLTQAVSGFERTVISLNPGKPGFQVLEQTVSAFCQGAPISLEKMDGPLHWTSVLHRARSGQHPPYSWPTFNCEHFVCFAHGVLPESPQVGVLAALGAILATVALAS